MEVLPNSIQLMAKAAQDAGLSVNGTVAEMQDLQKQGLLTSSKVLPFFSQRMHEAAIANGGLEKSLKSNRVAMNRMGFSLQQAANTFFTSGFSEGLSDLFNTVAISVKDLTPLFKALGKIAGSALSALAVGVKVITPLFEGFGKVLKGITDVFGELSFLITPITSLLLFKGITKATRAMIGFKTATQGVNSALASNGLMEILFGTGGKLRGIANIVKSLKGLALLLVTPFTELMAILGIASGVVDEIMNTIKDSKEQKVGVWTHPDKKGGGTVGGNILEQILRGAGVYDEDFKKRHPSITSFIEEPSMLAKYEEVNKDKKAPPPSIFDKIADSYHNMLYNPTSNTPTNVSLKGDIIMDGYRVGHIVAGSDAISDKIDSAVLSYQ